MDVVLGLVVLARGLHLRDPTKPIGPWHDQVTAAELGQTRG